MGRVSEFFRGGVVFGEDEDYQRFRFGFLISVMMIGCFTSLLFVILDYYKINIMEPHHLAVQKWHAALMVAFSFLLYGRKKMFFPVAIAAAVTGFVVLASAMYFVTNDEMRIIWFVTNIPPFFILLGTAAGLAAAFVSVVIILLINSALAVPYSANAVTTVVVSVIYMTAIFYYFSNKSFSYFIRMNEANRSLRVMAEKDPLTSLYNARAFYDICNGLVKLAERKNEDYSVLFIDLDHFKRVNDRYGHAAVLWF